MSKFHICLNTDLEAWGFLLSSPPPSLFPLTLTFSPSYYSDIMLSFMVPDNIPVYKDSTTQQVEKKRKKKKHG